MLLQEISTESAIIRDWNAGMKSDLKQYSYFTIHYIKASDNFFARGSAEAGF